MMIIKDADGLEKAIRRIENLRDKRDFVAAIEASNALLESELTYFHGLRVRAGVHRSMRNLALERSDREALVSAQEAEPADWFEYGVCLWRNGEYKPAADAFQKSIRIGDDENFHFYTNASRIHLAAVMIKMNRFDDAAIQAKLLPDGYSSYLPDGMMTKTKIIEMLGARR